MNNKRVIFSNTFWAKTILSIASLALLVSPLSTTFAYYNNNYNQPNVSTQNATNISNTAATLNGYIYGNNGSSTRAWFEYGTNMNLNSSTSKTSYGSNSSTNFDKTIYDLDSGTTYYFRAVAESNNDGIIYGDTYSFITGGYNNNNNNCYNNGYNCNYPYNYNNNNNQYYNGYGQTYYNQPVNSSSNLTALTTGATNVTYTSADLNALIQNGSGASANAWFEWGTSYSLGYATPTVSVDSLPSVNHVNTLGGLLPNTTYYFRAVAENSYWRNNGAILSFTTGGTKQINTVIYQPQAPTPTYNTAPPTPVQNNTVPNNNYNNPNPSNLGGAAILGGNSFLPQNIFGWLILVILFLILLLLVKTLYTPKVIRHESHEPHH